ncbi:hypothetical protein K4F52_001171 [Lecanicillium sp. MT-2017a]|nr:hypothetical protein K4F52_001171 [Lecanicillium sp. MT-2017a]
MAEPHGQPLLGEGRPPSPPTSPNPDGRHFPRGATGKHDHDGGPTTGNARRHQQGSPAGRQRLFVAEPIARDQRLAAVGSEKTQRYVLVTIFLSVGLLGSVVQTEVNSYVQRTLGWDKPYFMMYVTHCSWVAVWPVTIAVLRLLDRNPPWDIFWARHLQHVLATVRMIQLQSPQPPSQPMRRGEGVYRYMARMTTYLTLALTAAGSSWYIAVGMTTAADLTAIYSCSAFFTYAFSVPILKEPLGTDKSIAVVLAMLGVIITAYGGGTGDDATADPSLAHRLAGNILIALGSCGYGLYNVLYKRYACPPEGTELSRASIFAAVFSTCMGVFNVLVLWLPIPVLHYLGAETITLPPASTVWLVIVSVLSNAVSNGCFLALMSLTSPLLTSVATLMTIFLVALADWLLGRDVFTWATYVGGFMIASAFAVLCWTAFYDAPNYEKAALANWSDSDDDEDMDAGENSIDRYARNE